MKELQRFRKPSDYHKFANVPAPEHPLISLVDYSAVNYPSDVNRLKWVQDYYTIGLKRNVAHKLFYGQQTYDFDEGLMTFVAPNQVMSLTENPNIKEPPIGCLLLVHPDFLWNSPLAKQIKQYDFFGYAANEALFLSEKEEQMMLGILKNIQGEYQANIDKFSQNIVISQLTLLLHYAERFYERQFITRKISNHHILQQLEHILNNAFKETALAEKGIPTVTAMAEALHLSPNYLTSLLTSLTGQSTQQHIQNKLIEKAKEQLSTTDLSISEIAYNLGYEQPSFFRKRFKNKTQLSPLAFRRTFN